MIARGRLCSSPPLHTPTAFGRLSDALASSIDLHAMLHKRICYSPPAPPSSTTSSTNTASSPPQLGTILYHGPVPPTKGNWYGVEWDEPARGKHSGVYEKTGVRYFVPRCVGSLPLQFRFFSGLY